MKNLKKVLALVLVVAMMASFATVSAAFPDADAITNTEAVSVLTGLGVIGGYADGTFRPANDVTRGAFAKMVAYVMNEGKNAAASYATSASLAFSDVEATAVLAPSIGYVVSKGYVSGYTDGTFRSGNSVTGVAAAKILLGALGFKGEYTGEGWANRVLGDAEDAGLFKGLETVDLTVNLSRENAAQMIFNALLYSKTGTTCYLVDGSTIEFTDLTLAILAAGGDVSKVTPSTPKDTLMNEKFRATQGSGEDAFGRPYSKVWLNAKGEAIYEETAKALAVVTDGTFDASKTAKGETWYGYDFTNAVVTYNGGEGAVAKNALNKLGYTVEVYGAKNPAGVYVVTDLIVTEYYFATIKDVAANKNITLTVAEAGYAINNSGATKDIPVAYNATAEKQSANYNALAGYGKGDVIAVCVKPGWESSLTVLDVVVPGAVTGTVTAKAADAYYNGYIRIDGVKYTFANEYCQTPVAVGSKGTFYTLNNLIIGFVGETPVVVSDVAYVVDHFAKYIPLVPAQVDAYGTVLKDAVPAHYEIYAQAVNTKGEVVSFLVDANEDSSTDADNSTFTAYEQDIKKFTAQADGTYKVDEATEVTPIVIDKDLVVDATTTSGTNYYYNAAEFISVVGSKSTISVSAGSAALADGNAYAWAVYNKTESANKTVSKVFYWTASAGTPAPEHVVLYTGANLIQEQENITWADKSVKAVYTYDVYEAGVAKQIKTYVKDMDADFYEYYVDQYGICVVSELDGVMDTVDNIYGNYVTIEGVCENYDITGIKVVDLMKANPSVNTAANGVIDAGETVVFYAVATSPTTYSIDCIYIVDPLV